jgi:hypothetical protein
MSELKDIKQSGLEVGFVYHLSNQYNPDKNSFSLRKVLNLKIL